MGKVGDQTDKVQDLAATVVIARLWLSAGTMFAACLVVCRMDTAEISTARLDVQEVSSASCRGHGILNSGRGVVLTAETWNL